ncbi:acyltransferase family protein [Oerskovia enterophila]|uniref:acyltransferase family protein n=1 Tax=Oerskovia enterophila TaxID=43678 RepID=UPI0037F2473A
MHTLRGHVGDVAPATVDVARGGDLGPRPGTGLRTDIQALRAIAVGAVVVNHLWPTRLPGGFVGVDVFFVISGFLITSHLSKELQATGRIRLAQFYARRVRRLLPAALLVLAVSTVGVRAFLPFSEWSSNAREVAASAFYVENWVLAAKSVDYSALNESATVAQHYWSLSVEEQFYLVWPVLLGALYLIGRRSGRSPRTVATVAMVAVGAASLAVSIVYTSSHPNEAYFVTPVRVWEFGLGALVAFVGHRVLPRRALAEILSLLGLTMIVGSALVYGTETPFPGWTALVPAVGAALVIVAGMRRAPLLHDVVTARRPVQFLGDVSYSVYLWHWPLIVLAPFALARPVGRVEQVGILILSLALAWLTKVAVEDRARTWGWASAKPQRSLGLMLVGMLAVGGLTWGLHAQAVGAEDEAVAVAAAHTKELAACSGPLALREDAGCADPFGPAPAVVMGAVNQYWDVPPECGELLDELSYGETRTTRVCDFSDGDRDPEEVWLLGDSHAQQWQATAFEVARDRGWRLTISFLGACPPADVSYVGYRGTPDSAAKIETCDRWSADVHRAVLEARPSLVLTSSFARGEDIDDGTGRDELDQYRQGFQSYWAPWADAGVPVLVISDPPLNSTVRDQACIVQHPTSPVDCRVERTVAQPLDPMMHAATTMDHPRVHSIDLSRYFCDETWCYAVVGGMPVYYDADHLNRLYAKEFGPLLADAVDAIDATAG